VNNKEGPLVWRARPQGYAHSRQILHDYQANMTIGMLTACIVYRA